MQYSPNVAAAAAALFGFSVVIILMWRHFGRLLSAAWQAQWELQRAPRSATLKSCIRGMFNTSPSTPVRLTVEILLGPKVKRKKGLISRHLRCFFFTIQREPTCFFSPLPACGKINYFNVLLRCEEFCDFTSSSLQDKILHCSLVNNTAITVKYDPFCTILPNH